jgi:hypothetical protein
LAPAFRIARFDAGHRQVVFSPGSTILGNRAFEVGYGQ